MHRFFVAPELLARSAPATFSLPDKFAHQVRDVLRLAIGEQLILLDNSGDEILCIVTKNNRAGVEVQVLERQPGQREPGIQIMLCQGLLKAARFEWVLEKGTELGVTTFMPILCRRSLSGLEDAGSHKLQRWQRILQEAAEQSRRSRIPTLLSIRPLRDALNAIPAAAIALMPWEEERTISLQEAMRIYKANQAHTATKPLTVVLFIGPEGGLMSEEVKLAQRHGVQTVTLGPRILRAETAAIATVANIVYELEVR